MKAISIIEDDDGRIVLTYSPDNPDTSTLIRLLHSAMSMVTTLHTDGSQHA